MRTLILIITFVGIAAGMTYGQSGSHNYISTQVMQNTAGSQYQETIRYFGGLGREVEQVQCRVTPSGQNWVSLQPVTGKLHSPEYDRDFSVQDAKLQLLKEHDNLNKFRLSLNGQNILDWFKQKNKGLFEQLGVKKSDKIGYRRDML